MFTNVLAVLRSYFSACDWGIHNAICTTEFSEFKLLLQYVILIWYTLTCWIRFKIFKVFHTFKWFVSCVHVVILPCILVTRHQRKRIVFSFAFTSRLTSWLACNAHRSSMFSFMALIPPCPSKFSPSQIRSGSVPFNINHFRFSWTFLIAYPRPKEVLKPRQ
jgi:hypothetical protein